MSRDRFRELYDEAFDLRGSHLQRLVIDELVLEWDRKLRRDQQTLAIWRLFRETNPRPEGGRRAA